MFSVFAASIMVWCVFTLVVVSPGCQSRSLEDKSYYLGLEGVQTSSKHIFQGGWVANPVAAEGATVIDASGKARFTVLTGQLIRMEYQSEGRFEDRASIAVMNRKLPVPEFTVEYENKTNLLLRTGYLSLNYSSGRPFSPTTLCVTSLHPDNEEGRKSQRWQWCHGDSDHHNLLGTYSSLDAIGSTAQDERLRRVDVNCSKIRAEGLRVHEESLHCSPGVLSRAGWVVLNQTGEPALESLGVEGPLWWSDKPATSTEDLYLFGHGTDFPAALRDFQAVSGPPPLLPRAMLGVMYTRWFNFNAPDLNSLVSLMTSLDLPLDAIILDMNFHLAPWWTGYSFDPTLFPHPAWDLAHLTRRGIMIGVNLHDAEGVRPHETKFREMSEALGRDPDLRQTIPFSVCNSSKVSFALEDIVVKHLKDLGVGFIWTDWQQGEKAGGCEGGSSNPRVWLAHLRSTAALRQHQPPAGVTGAPPPPPPSSSPWGARGAGLARWGGLGSHRYPVGFSGDVSGLTWESLAFQPYFSMTAANVAYSWSHDLLGPGKDPELTVRWLQWGAFSSVFRMHDRGLSAGGCVHDEFPFESSGSDCGVVDPWLLPSKYFTPAREAMQVRSSLVPYLYTAQRAAFDSGVQMLRPVYHDYPEADMAYQVSSYEGCLDLGRCEYMLGAALLVSPVLQPAAQQETSQGREKDKEPGGGSGMMARKNIWLPPGVWVEQHSGTVFQVPSSEGRDVIRHYDLTEVPVFVRGGAVLPSLPIHSRVGSLIGRAQQQYHTLELTVYPGANSGSCEVYEDDGVSRAYESGGFGWTNMSFTRAPGLMRLRLLTALHHNTASYSSHPDSKSPHPPDSSGVIPSVRTYILRIVNSFPPEEVHLNGVLVPQSRGPVEGEEGGDSSRWWRYEGSSASLIIHLGGVVSTEQQALEVLVRGYTEDLNGQLSGLKGLVKRAGMSKALLDEVRQTPGYRVNDVEGNPGYLQRLAALGEVLTYNAIFNMSEFRSSIADLQILAHNATAELSKRDHSVNPKRLDYAKLLLSSARAS